MKSLSFYQPFDLRQVSQLVRGEVWTLENVHYALFTNRSICGKCVNSCDAK